MLDGNIKNLHVFEKNPWAGSYNGGFNRDNTKEGYSYWESITDKIVTTKMKA